MIESFPSNYARLTKNRYCCATCWRDLEMIEDPAQHDHFFVLCISCKDETRGYVTKYYVERRRSDSIGEEVSAKKLLRKLGIIPNPLEGMSAQDLIKSLGYH